MKVLEELNIIMKTRILQGFDFFHLKTDETFSTTCESPKFNARLAIVWISTNMRIFQPHIFIKCTTKVPSLNLIYSLT